MWQKVNRQSWYHKIFSNASVQRLPLTWCCQATACSFLLLVPHIGTAVPCSKCASWYFLWEKDHRHKKKNINQTNKDVIIGWLDYATGDMYKASLHKAEQASPVSAIFYFLRCNSIQKPLKLIKSTPIGKAYTVGKLPQSIIRSQWQLK